MLQGIVNISKNIDRSEVKKDYRLNGKHKAYLDQDSNNDLIQISPAFKYLASLNWKVQNINVNEKDKIVLCFSINEFEFRTTIDVKMISDLNKIYINVRKNSNSGKTDMVFSIPIAYVMNESSENIVMDTFKILFSRIEYLTRTKGIDLSENKLSYGIYEDLIPGLKSEFQNILYAIFNFVEKLTSQKILERLINLNPGSNYETIRLENVEVR